MAALVEGHQYGLSSENSTSVHKSVVHCKLTDSALKALEEFQRIKSATTTKPSIQFHGHNGVITVPCDGPENTRSFTFSLSTIPLDPKGSFEVIRQDDASHDQELDLLGTMLHKVSVQGTDDSYRAARERMITAEEDSKKQRAKEIKPSGPYSGMRVKKVVRKPIPAPPASSIPKPAPQPYKPGQLGSRPPLHREEAPTPAQRPNTLPGNLLKPSTSSSSSSSSKPSPTTTGPQPKPVPVAPANQHKPALSSNHNAIINIPFRDRVIHLLAVRPYKKPELLIRLQKDGLKEKDKSTLTQVLNEVGTFNPRDKNFSLARHMYSEVRTEWPHYTDFDRQLLKRKMNQMQEPSLSANTSPAVSPCHSTGSQGSPNSSQKRVMEEERPLPDNPSKKQRLAHSSNHRHSNTSSSNNKSDSTHSDSQHLSKPDSQGSKPDNHGCKPDNHGYKPSQSDSFNVNTSKTTNKSSSSLVSPVSPGNQENNNLLDMGVRDRRDYTKDYGKIQTGAQRQKYKVDFNREYTEYRELHAKIEKITNKFMELKEQLERQPKDTPDHRNIRKRIMSEYRLVKEDPKFLEQRDRHDYLHHKLGYIKKLISEFDHSRLGVS